MDQLGPPAEVRAGAHRDTGVEEELARVVAGARRVKVAGAGHSFTDIACTDGVMVDMGGMRRVLEVDGDEVTVEAGITLRELGEELRARGLAMENQGDVDPQTIAGAISTATHGTGGRFGNLSSQVAGMRLVTGTGELRELREGDELRAARVGLGALGAISAVTVRCVPAFTIHRMDEPRPLDDVLPSLDELVDANDHFEAFVIPYTRRALTLTSERTDRSPSRRAGWPSSMRDVVLENARARPGLSHRAGVPAPDPVLNRRLAGLMSRTEQLDASHRVYANARLVRFTEMEYAIPREHAARGARARAGPDRAPPPADRLPDRAARGGGRRRLPLDRLRTPDRLHRRAPVPRNGVRDLLPRGGGDHGRLRRPAALGQAPLPVGRAPWRRAIRSGSASRRSVPRFDPERQVRERLPRARARAAAPERPVERDHAAVARSPPARAGGELPRRRIC